MKRMPRTWKVGPAGVLVLTSLAGCVVGGYGGGVGLGYVGGVYEPGGYEYGGWGPGYRVGPPRGDEHGHGGDEHGHGGGDHGPGRGRATPSIPHDARHGGGGGHRGGGNGH
jgi:hypothetical protein